MKFNQALKKAREKAGLSQKQLADMLNVPASMISRYESTDTEPRISFALKIIHALNITPNTFFNYNIFNSQPINKELLELRKAAGFTISEISEKLKIPIEKYTAFETGKQIPSLSTLNALFLFYTQKPLDETTACFFSPLVYARLISINSEIEPFAKMDLNEDTGKICFYQPNLNIIYEFEPHQLQKIIDIAEEKVIKKQASIYKELLRYEIAKAIVKLNPKTSNCCKIT